MNALVTASETRPARQIVEDVIPILDTARFEHMQRIATIMANASLVPEALRTYKEGEKIYPLPFEAIMANCFLVVNQATRWGMDPFGVAQCVSIVKGKFCYEGKLVAAVLDARLGVALSYTYDDKPGDTLGVVVSGVVDGSTKTVEGTVAAWKTSGSGSPWVAPAYKRQLAYRGAREWARIHKPALMLGAYTDDELDDLQESSRANRAREVPPAPPALTVVPPRPMAETKPAVEDATIISETAAGAPPPGQPAAQDAGASQGSPSSDEALASEDSSEIGINPDDEIANLIDKLAHAKDEATIEEWYAETDIEAALAEFTGYVEKARAVKAQQIDRVNLAAKRAAASATSLEETAPPPPNASTLADDDEAVAPPPPPTAEDNREFDVDGWKGLTTKPQYITYIGLICAYAEKVGNSLMLETFWNESQPLRAKVMPFAERAPFKEQIQNSMIAINKAKA